MFIHKLINRDFLENGGFVTDNADGKRHGGHDDGHKVIHSFPRDKLWILWITLAFVCLGSGALWIVFRRICVLLYDGSDGIGDVNALGAVAVGERLDELVLDDALIVEHT